MFFAMQKTDFHLFKLFAEKVILELNCTKSLLIASKSTNSVFSANDEIARPRMLKNFCFSEKKFKCNFKSKAQKKQKNFFNEEMFLPFCLSNNSVFSANDEIARPRMLKNFCFSEKKLPKCNFKSKAQKHDKCSF